MPKLAPAVAPAPHSWPLKRWPASVWPGDSQAARQMARLRRTELIKHGCVTRIGKELIFLGAPFTRWLESRRSLAVPYDIAPNDPARRNHAPTPAVQKSRTRSAKRTVPPQSSERA